METLIEAARAHAMDLRENAMLDDGYGACATVEEAERWEQLAATAEAEVMTVRSNKSAT